jgi:hypothetical protein
MPPVAVFARRVHIVCGDYHRYWLVPGLVRNARADKNTHRLLSLKGACGVRQSEAIWYFGTALAARLAPIIGARRIHIAIVPSHEANVISVSLQRIVRHHIEPAFDVANTKNPLRRHTKVPMRSTGGTRSLQSVLESVEVVPNVLEPNATVVLLDDVMTTGGSLRGCYELLKRAGARDVIPVALLRTASVHASPSRRTSNPGRERKADPTRAPVAVSDLLMNPKPTSPLTVREPSGDRRTSPRAESPVSPQRQTRLERTRQK